MMVTNAMTLLVAGALLGGIGCNESEADSGGQALFERPLAGGNTFACNTCHALSEPAADGFRRPAHPIGDATRRPSYKNGQVTDMLDAVNTCLTEWMVADPWTADDPDYQRLYAFLDSHGEGDSAPPLSFERVDPPERLTGADAGAGRELFDRACAICHGAGASGTERAPSLSGELLDAVYIAARVRTSGSSESQVYSGLSGGRMPFWARDRLSDDELRDLIAFVLSNDPDDGEQPGTDQPDAGSGDDCPKSHPLVGQSAELSTLFHGVSGTATVVDDCTVEITSFDYDGTGIDVRVYGGNGGNYDQGFAMSGDLIKSGGYTDETIVAKLPDGKSFDDLDGISIWCVAVGQSFGEADF